MGNLFAQAPVAVEIRSGLNRLGPSCHFFVQRFSALSIYFRHGRDALLRVRIDYGPAGRCSCSGAPWLVNLYTLAYGRDELAGSREPVPIAELSNQLHFILRPGILDSFDGLLGGSASRSNRCRLVVEDPTGVWSEKLVHRDGDPISLFRLLCECPQKWILNCTGGTLYHRYA